MSDPIRWESQIDGKTYVFSYEKLWGKHILTINGTPTVLNDSFMSAILGFDEPFILGDKEARLVLGKGQADIVVDGIHLQSGNPYRKRPTWVVTFFVLCMLIPLVSIGRVAPMLLGIGGVIFCAGVSNTSLSTAQRVFFCTVITGAIWAFYLFFFGGLGALV